jgi:hypothetical protein
MIWIKILIIAMAQPSHPITHKKSSITEAYLYYGVNPTYTTDTIRMYSNMRFHVGDSVEVGIYPKRIK